MPSTISMITGLIVTGGILAAGGYAASYFPNAVEDGASDQPTPNKRMERPGTASGAMRSIASLAAGSEAEDGSSAQSVQGVPVSNDTADTSNDAADSDQASSAGISLTITNIRNDSGNIIVLVFDDKIAYKNYDYEKAADYAEIPAQAGSMSVDFPSLNAGPYAIGVFHDEDKNQDLNVDGNGNPTEGYGTSGASGPYDDPSFKKASVSPGNVTVKMHYLQ